jgi:G:T-mismatch repair DNA endonuclease (very short patch repair protein)
MLRLYHKNTIKRDEEVKTQLEKLDWKVITIWECETTNNNSLATLLIQKLKRDIR